MVGVCSLKNILFIIIAVYLNHCTTIMTAKNTIFPVMLGSAKSNIIQGKIFSSKEKTKLNVTIEKYGGVFLFFAIQMIEESGKMDTSLEMYLGGQGQQIYVENILYQRRLFVPYCFLILMGLCSQSSISAEMAIYE